MPETCWVNKLHILSHLVGSLLNSLFIVCLFEHHWEMNLEECMTRVCLQSIWSYLTQERWKLWTSELKSRKNLVRWFVFHKHKFRVFTVLMSQWPVPVAARSTALASCDRGFEWMFVSCVCCVLSGKGLCDELITRPEESYRLWHVVVCDQKPRERGDHRPRLTAEPEMMMMMRIIIIIKSKLLFSECPNTWNHLIKNVV
jgi:hypothetical protein